MFIFIWVVNCENCVNTDTNNVRSLTFYSGGTKTVANCFFSRTTYYRGSGSIIYIQGSLSL